MEDRRRPESIREKYMLRNIQLIFILEGGRFAVERLFRMWRVKKALYSVVYFTPVF
jgi:hypothetical protein